MPDNKDVVGREISELLGQPHTATSRSGTVTRLFVVRVAGALGVPASGIDKVSVMRACVERVGGVWDERCSSEATESGGGGNITLTALERLRDGVARVVQEEADNRADGARRAATGRLPVEDLLEDLQAFAETHGAFDPSGLEDAREIALRGIVLRRGQSAFRTALLARYGGRCVMTGCDAPPALEAAHIVPYRGPATNDVDNGLLLRADIHTLFDLGQIAVDPDRLVVLVSGSLEPTVYGGLAGRPLGRPIDGAEPPRDALRWHREWTGL